MIDGYEILGELARGAMGVVYRARDTKLGRDVALKLVLTETPSPADTQRFLREGEITAQLDHPGIVRIHASGVHDGQPFLVYELVEGARPLSDAMRELPLPRRLELLRDAAAALGSAHAHGVVHRDVKPDNVLVDAQDRVRVADFGLASAEGLTRLTRTGALLGTPHYMAPEQITADRERIGPPADVWALGVMLYQALADQLPFAGESFIALSAQIATGLTAPPSRAATDLAAPIPPQLDAICSRALASAPDERYPDAGAFADELDAFLRGEPPQAYLAQLRTRRRRMVFAALALGLVMVGAAAHASRDERPAPTPPSARASGGADQAPPATSSPSAVEDTRTRRRRIREARRAPLFRQRVLAETMSLRVLFAGPRRFFCWSPGRSGLQLWTIEGQELRLDARWEKPEGLNACADVIPDPKGGYLVAGRPAIWRLDTAQHTPQVLFRAPPGVRFLAVSPDGERIACATQQIHIYDRSGHVLEPPKATTGAEIRGIAFSSDGSQLVWVVGSAGLDAFGKERSLYTWDMTPAEPVRARLLGVPGPIRVWPKEPLGLIGVGSTVHVFELGKTRPRASLLGANANKVRHALQGPASHGFGVVKEIWLRPDASRVFSLSSALTDPRPLSELRCWDLPAGDEVGMALSWPEYCTGLAVSADEELLLVGTGDGEILGWWLPALTEAAGK